MIDLRTEKRWIDFLFWLMAAFALVIILTSCSPLSALPTSEPTAAPMATRAPKILGLPSPTASAKPVQSCQVRTGIPAGHLNLRNGAGVSFSVIRVLAEGETLQVIKPGAWLQVIDDQGKQGFINSRYCQVKP